uniref:Uncharacterized protein n=1 Tax=Chromera velia CCMP2878 TaxID=1169474 RepID=A0A0G4HGI6_9ALVE|eukprot:Cvel_27366.t1-p1 / transcript=Cvel_27366.t1 / gene=Cvel_27366 / organism=Chromera_velia_CCMP2878 / gene_product=hypothetical protein / transcript_product=hypothetical protein / location=Cvel_scaffold3402:5946-6221(+) / protein_length=92 / sequence_SO=supercontig / SO=protein_coding / is_pseudo=false
MTQPQIATEISAGLPGAETGKGKGRTLGARLKGTKGAAAGLRLGTVKAVEDLPTGGNPVGQPPGPTPRRAICFPQAARQEEPKKKDSWVPHV